MTLFQTYGIARANFFTQAKPTTSPPIRFGAGDKEIEALQKKPLTFEECARGKDQFIRMVMEVEKNHTHSDQCGHGSAAQASNSSLMPPPPKKRKTTHS